MIKAITEHFQKEQPWASVIVASVMIAICVAFVILLWFIMPREVWLVAPMILWCAGAIYGLGQVEMGRTRMSSYLPEVENLSFGQYI